MRSDEPSSHEQHAPSNRVIDLHEAALEDGARGPVWTSRSEDLNVNLIVLPKGEEIPEHVNSEVDVLIVPISGSGRLTIEDGQQLLKPGVVVLITKGSRRVVQATSERFAYLTCHRRRASLWPKPR